MRSDPDIPQPRPLSELAWFFGLVFGLSWGVGGLALLLNLPFGPAFFLAGWAPTLAALGLTLIRQGVGGLKDLLQRLVRPFNPVWLAVAALVLPLLGLLLTLLPGWPVKPRTILVALPLLLFGTAQIVRNTGPLGEELGWRGYALPRLLERTSALNAALVIGAFWSLWHVPAFFVSGAMGSSIGGFGWWAMDTFALSLLMTWLFLRTGGNVLVAGMVPHFVINGMGAVGGWLARPQEAVLFALLAVTLTAADRKRMLARPAGLPARPGARG